MSTSLAPSVRGFGFCVNDSLSQASQASRCKRDRHYDGHTVTYGSERNCSALDEEIVKRGDCRVNTEACTPAMESKSQIGRASKCMGLTQEGFGCPRRCTRPFRSPRLRFAIFRNRLFLECRVKTKKNHELPQYRDLAVV